jgi:hypothetical protein
MGHAGLALKLQRNQRMGCTPRRPSIFSRAEKPDSIGGEAGRLGGAGNLDKRVVGLGSKEGFVKGASEEGKEFLP